MSAERKKAIIYLSILDTSLLLFILAFAIVFKPWEVIDHGAESICFVQKHLHIYCPGCGGTRAVGYLLRLDLYRAFIHYPPIFVGIALIIWINVLFIRSIKVNSLSPLTSHKYYEFISLPVVIILVFLIRNILLHNGIDMLGDFY